MLLSLAVLANATLILTCIFFPKIYAIFFVSKSNQHVSPGFRVTGGARRLTVLQPHSSRAELLVQSSRAPILTPNGRVTVDTENIEKDNDTGRKEAENVSGNTFNGTIQLQVSPVDGVCGPFTEIGPTLNPSCILK